MKKTKAKKKRNLIVKSLCLRLETGDEVRKARTFQKLAIYSGKSTKDMILEMMEGWIRNDFPAFGLLTESEVLALAKKIGAPASGPSLKKWRRLGALIKGEDYFTGPEGGVVYNYDSVNQLLKKRKKAPYSRVEIKEEAVV
jgi:hypothetical protein